MTKNLGLSPALYAYLQDHSVREPEVLTQLRAETQGLPGAEMQIAPEQGQFMALLVQLLGARRTLEVGVFTGYSALVVALALPEDGQVIACDVDPNTGAIAQRYWQAAGVADKIDFRLGPALETLDQLLADGQAGTFDFAFIDADKRNYPHYYERCLQLVRVGGLVAIDNVLWSGRVAAEATTDDPSTAVIRAFNAQVYQDERVSLSMVAIADGLTLALKR
ncbi:MAG: SAM-dependent methyltransferase [Synechococcales cyanobacterium RU_4_20]|nr:SAM-dependent methyltransferase [Synechococcales cyanobacterium RU_4_20]NJR69185.1 SAM-dependent methyltransferase [Synechococcales cyanobacterium CRU_2_2]